MTSSRRDARRRREVPAALGCMHSDTAIAGRPRKRPSIAAATVPEYSTSSPRFAPSLMPETTMSCSSSNRPGDREVHAVRRRAVDDVVLALAELEDAQRHVERQRVAGAAAVAVGRDDGDLGQRRKRVAQALQALGAIAVVVADENFHVGGVQASACERRRELY